MNDIMMGGCKASVYGFNINWQELRGVEKAADQSKVTTILKSFQLRICNFFLVPCFIKALHVVMPSSFEFKLPNKNDIITDRATWNIHSIHNSSHTALSYSFHKLHYKKFFCNYLDKSLPIKPSTIYGLIKYHMVCMYVT